MVQHQFKPGAEVELAEFEAGKGLLRRHHQ